jgi:hypothetical protein
VPLLDRRITQESSQYVAPPLNSVAIDARHLGDKLEGDLAELSAGARLYLPALLRARAIALTREIDDHYLPRRKGAPRQNG